MTKRHELRGTSRLRSDELPDDLMLLLRGGSDTLERNLEQIRDCGDRYTLDGKPFYALSVTAVLDGDTEDDLLADLPLVRHEKFYRMTAGQLREADFGVWATFRNPRHFSVRMADASKSAYQAFLAVVGALHDNDHYENDDEEVEQ